MALHTTAFPFIVTSLTATSALLCLPMIALAMINFGTLSIGLNALLAILIFTHHATFTILSLKAKKRLMLARKRIVIDDADSSIFDPNDAPPPAYDSINVAALTFLLILNAIAFSIMVDITSRGALKSTLPAERVGSHKWNIKIQIGQTGVLGVELLLLAANLALCALGAKRIEEEKQRREAELECGMISPVVRFDCFVLSLAKTNMWFTVTPTRTHGDILGYRTGPSFISFLWSWLTYLRILGNLSLNGRLISPSCSPQPPATLAAEDLKSKEAQHIMFSVLVQDWPAGILDNFHQQHGTSI
ncbi:hypothetical protein D9619_006827 [Psilocybe cf. subviscida]|uniref:Uncharacterized protein n=1 Tax=Psilocybe cf. subviscida TaxID=2480587 RepID=A0A8H5B6Q9_9AGAR|nr:hypothetical protein D9619_006827 [Psilocybe cf. subviscida]